MGSVQLTRLKLPASTLGVKLLEREEQVNFFIWYVMRNFSQNRIEVEPLSGIHIPPLLGGILPYLELNHINSTPVASIKK
jgi:hypothetical protein